MLTKMPTQYNGVALSMTLPLHVVGDEDCVHIMDHAHKCIVEGMLNATDAHYIVDAVNEYQIVREAKRDALCDLKKWVWNYLRAEHTGSFGKACEDIRAEITRRIEVLKR